MSKRKLNVELLRKIKKHILEEPKRMVMGDWVQKKDEVRYGTGRHFVEDASSAGCSQHEFGECNTAACIGGWALILKNKPFHNISATAAKLLGLDNNYDYDNDADNVVCQADRVFVVEYWPSPFKRDYMRAKTPKGKASAAARRIDHLIKTRGND